MKKMCFSVILAKYTVFLHSKVKFEKRRVIRLSKSPQMLKNPQRG